MINSVGIPLSGLNAAGKRLESSANNTANQFSTLSTKEGETVKEPYAPTQVDNVSIETGGVNPVVRNINPSSVPVYDPENIAANEDGITQYPNVDPEREVIQQKIATYDFKANLNVLKTQDNMMKSLLDILG